MEIDESNAKVPPVEERLYQQVLEQSDLCDVMVQVGKWRKKFHWRVLVMSPFFKYIRQRDFIEKITGLVDLEAADSVTTEATILFMYGKHPMLTVDNVTAILDLAEFLLIPSLKASCISFLKKDTITAENCIRMLELSSLYEFEFYECQEYLRGHLHQVLRRQEAVGLTKESVLNLFTDPFLSYLTAKERFEFLVRWAEVSQQNKDAFSDLYSVIDIEDLDSEFIETEVLQNSLVSEEDKQKISLFPRNTPHEHRVLLFCNSTSTPDRRTMCFDIDSNRWCAINTGPPKGSKSIAFIAGVRGTRKIYRLDEDDHRYKICIQDFVSNEYSVRLISGVSASCFPCVYYFGRDMLIIVSNADKDVNRPISKTCLSDGHNTLRTGTCTRKAYHRRRIDYATVSLVQLQNSETESHLSPILTLLDTYVDSVSVTENNLIAFYSRRNSHLQIYDVSNGRLDTLSLEKYFGSYNTDHYIKLSVNRDTFILNDNKIVLTVSRLTGPEVSERYATQRVMFEKPPPHKNFTYSFINGTCVRQYMSEYSIMSHYELMNSSVTDRKWLQLPNLPDISGDLGPHIIALELPKSMLRCHYACPHCVQQIQQQFGDARARKYMYDHQCDDYTDDDVYEHSDNDFSQESSDDNSFDREHDCMGLSAMWESIEQL